MDGDEGGAPGGAAAHCAASPAVLRKLQRMYHGAPGALAAAAHGAGPPALLAIARTRGATSVEAPPSEVAVFVVGDPGSGKSSFINGYAQELLFQPGGGAGAAPLVGPRAAPLRWVRSSSAGAGLPSLLATAASEFPEALPDPAVCLAGAAACPRLDAVDLVEVRAQALADEKLSEALAWMAARAGVVLCLADSQRQTAISAALLAWLKRVMAHAAPQCLQFALSKVDLVARESDRIRLTAKVSRLLSEGLGRTFEVLPIARKDSRRVLLEALRSAPEEVTVGGAVFQVPPALPEEGADPLDAGTVRVMRAADACAAERLEHALARLPLDAAAARSAAAAQLAVLPPSGSGAGGAADVADVRARLFQLALAMAVAAFLVPFVIDEDMDPDVVFMLRAIVFGIAGVLMSLFVCLLGAGRSRSKASAELVDVTAPPAPGFEAVEALATKLQEEVRFCDLVIRQCAAWSGAKPDG